MRNFLDQMKLKIFSFIPTSILEFLAKRIHQDSLLFASIASLTTKLGYFFLMDVQLRGLILIILFFMFYLGNFKSDFYHLYIRERFFRVLANCMGSRALFTDRFKDHYYQEDYWNGEVNTSIENYQKIPERNYSFKEPQEHLGHVIFRNILFYLVYLRLYIRTHQYLFLFLHTLLVYFLLFNQFLLTTYLIAFLLISSRMVYHVTDFTVKDIKRTYEDFYFHSIHKYPENPINMLPTWNNAILYTFHIFRFEPLDWRRKEYLINHEKGELYNNNVLDATTIVYNLGYYKEENPYNIKAIFSYAKF